MNKQVLVRSHKSDLVDPYKTSVLQGLVKKRENNLIFSLNAVKFLYQVQLQVWIGTDRFRISSK